MRRKRFRHHVDIFCDMFCGWRLLNCADQLTELGSGTYDLDFISRRYSRDGSDLGGLSIGEEIAIWWREDMQRSSIELGEVDEARLTARLTISPLKGPRTTSDHYPLNPRGRFFTCAIETQALLRSGDHVFESAKRDVEEWPHPLAL